MATGQPRNAPPAAESDLPIHRISLKSITQTGRSRELARLQSYYECTQYDHYRFDWAGNYQGYDSDAPIKPGWYVPLRRRKPSARWDLARMTVARFTALLFGIDRWPEISVAGDGDAEDYCKELVNASRLRDRMIEARKFGGSEGTACLSFAFVSGKPRIQIHDPKYVTVLSWADPSEYRPGAVLEAYHYKRREVQDGKIRDVGYYYARYWDRFREIVWSPIPEDIGDRVGWSRLMEHTEYVHDFGLCPFYWIQNLPDSYDVDGEADYQGQLDNIDEINRLLSATSKGTIGNIDPTLVIKEDPARNDGSVQKGSGQAIFSKGGAEYLTIPGDGIKAALDLLKELRQSYLETVQVVMADPDKLAARGMSGEALRIVFAPMLAKTDLLRVQYGNSITNVVRDMLRAAKLLSERVDVGISSDGAEVAMVQTVELEPRVETVEGDEDPETGKKEILTRRVKRMPGQSEAIELNWGPYFPATWVDIQNGTRAAREGAGDKQVMSLKTAVKLIASMTGIKDIEGELEAIETDQEMAAERGARLFGEPSGGPGEPPKPEPKEIEGEDTKPGKAARNGA